MKLQLALWITKVQKVLPWYFGRNQEKEQYLRVRKCSVPRVRERFLKIMSIRDKKFSKLLGLLIFLSGCGPTNFDECILENTKGVNDKTAAELIYLSCKNKFPEKTEKPCNLIEFEDSQKAKIKYSIPTISDSKYLEIEFYNGNETLDIREMFASITYSGEQRKYNFSLNVVPPLSAGSGGAHLSEIPTSDWSVKINSVKGCKKP